MANIVCNISKGLVAARYDQVKSNSPANSAFILVPLEFTGLEPDSVLIDAATLAALLSGTTNEQTTMGRKTLTDADLAAIPAPDNANDRNDRSLPTVTWTAATGNRIAKIAVCYDPDTTTGTDADIIPMTIFDFDQTPSGADIQMLTGLFFRAQG